MSRLKQQSPLRRVRKSRTINQEELARLAGVTQETIGKAERGIVPISKDLKIHIATILGASVEELFPESGS